MTKYFHDQWRRIKYAKFEFEQIQKVGSFYRRLINIASVASGIFSAAIIAYYLERLSLGRKTSVIIGSGGGGLVGMLTKESLTKLIPKKKENPYDSRSKYPIR